jgi:hypothetical protein
MPPAGSLKVLHAPARRGGIRRASQTKIYNLETREFVSNPPFSKTNLAAREEEMEEEERIRKSMEAMRGQSWTERGGNRRNRRTFRD